MIPLETLIALAALTLTEPTAPMPPCSPDSLRAAAVALEIMDDREAKWYFRYPSEMESDLRSMRGRWLELRDAPPLCDSARFPRGPLCWEMRQANERYRRWQEERKTLFPADGWIEEALIECGRLHRVWDLAHDVQAEYYSAHCRRSALAELRDLIGMDAYYGGFLPAPVPVWRFRRIE